MPFNPLFFQLQSFSWLLEVMSVLQIWLQIFFVQSSACMVDNCTDAALCFQSGPKENQFIMMLVSSPCKNLKSSFASSQMNATVWWATWQVDSLLGARGGSSEHEATRKTRNEFMAAWDGLRSKDNERVLVLAATNRPFDLDDAVIRRLPRRYYVLTNLPETILQESSSWIQM